MRPAHSPLRQQRGPGPLAPRVRLVTGLWHQCHGALSQLFSGFTLPMQLVGENWQPPNLPEIGSIKALDAFIQPL